MRKWFWLSFKLYDGDHSVSYENVIHETQIIIMLISIPVRYSNFCKSTTLRIFCCWINKVAVLIVFFRLTLCYAIRLFVKQLKYSWTERDGIIKVVVHKKLVRYKNDFIYNSELDPNFGLKTPKSYFSVHL